MEHTRGILFDGDRNLTGEIRIDLDVRSTPWRGLARIPTHIEPLELLRPCLTLKLLDGRSGQIDVQSVDPNTGFASFAGIGQPPRSELLAPVGRS